MLMSIFISCSAGLSMNFFKPRDLGNTSSNRPNDLGKHFRKPFGFYDKLICPNSLLKDITESVFRTFAINFANIALGWTDG